MRAQIFVVVVFVLAACGSAAPEEEAREDGIPQMGQCSEPDDCGEAMTCIGTQCVPANCEDFVRNGNETDVDCGGDCAPCTEGLQCLVAFDCVSQACGVEGTCRDCETSVDCEGAPGTYCSSGICILAREQGAVCSDGEQCATGNCVDGVCCDGPCDGECESCDGTGSCVAVPAGTDPDDECADPARAGACGVTGLCNGEGQCGMVADATPCSIEGCATGDSAQGTCADGFCETEVEPSCGNYACVDDACLVECSGANVDGDSDCADGYFCFDGESCVRKQGNGRSCDEGRECLSGNCVDGVCCNSGCSGTCESCLSPDNGLSDSDGVCGNIPAGQGNECSDEGAESCGQNGECDGSGACRDYPGSTECAEQVCINARLYPATTCGLDGSCDVGSGSPCGRYYCRDSTSCDTDCPSNSASGDAECQPSYYCDGNSCEVKLGDGDDCTRDGQCGNGQCIDGVCCGLMHGIQCPEATHHCPVGPCVERTGGGGGCGAKGEIECE